MGYFIVWQSARIAQQFSCTRKILHPKAKIITKVKKRVRFEDRRRRGKTDQVKGHILSSQLTLKKKIVQIEINVQEPDKLIKDLEALSDLRSSRFLKCSSYEPLCHFFLGRLSSYKFSIQILKCITVPDDWMLWEHKETSTTLRSLNIVFLFSWNLERSKLLHFKNIYINVELL